MEAIEVLYSHLQKDHQQTEIDYRKAINVAFKILESEDKSSRNAARDEITRPGYSLAAGNAIVKNCPFLLGCLQAVIADDINLLESWDRSLNKQDVASFLKDRRDVPDAPIPIVSDFAYAQAALACARAAIAFKKFDVNSFYKHASRASHLFNGIAGGGPPVTGLPTDAFLSDRTESIETCSAVLSDTLKIPVAQARDLTQWFFAPSNNLQPKDQRRIWVPFFREGASGAAILEVDKRNGNGACYPDPVDMAFRHWDAEFKNSQDDALSYLKDKLHCWQTDHDVSWRFLARDDVPPLMSLTGGSASGAFFAVLWHLQQDIPNDLSVTISARITSEGKLKPVDNIEHKLVALNKYRQEKRNDVSQVVVASGQTGVDDRHGELQIFRIDSVADPERHGCQNKAKSAR